MAGLWGVIFGSWAWIDHVAVAGRQPARATRSTTSARSRSPSSPSQFGVGVGEMLADVAQPRRAEEGVGDGVQDDVGVGMAEQAAGVVDPDPAQDQRPPLDQPMRVVTDPHPHPPPLPVLDGPGRRASTVFQRAIHPNPWVLGLIAMPGSASPRRVPVSTRRVCRF